MIPTFTTSRLILLPLSIEHADDYAKHFIDYEVIRYLSDSVPWPYPKDGVKDYIQNVILPVQGKDRWVWGIFLKKKPEELIGCVDLWRNQKGRLENRGFWLGRKFWGRGIMTEACIPVNDYAFNHLGFEKLVFTNALGNIASRKVKEKTGCRFIETQPAKFVDPELSTQEVWELSKDDWELFRNS